MVVQVQCMRYFPSVEGTPHYPYKTIRRLGPPPQKPWGREKARLAVQEPPPPPSEREAAEAAARLPDGAFSLLRQARRSNSAGDHGRAHRAAALALAAAPENAGVVEAAAAQQAAARSGALLSSWRAAVAFAAAREAKTARWVVDAAARRVARQASSVPKPRQGYSKALMRLLHVRLCSSCRALRPRLLLWRVVRLRPAPPAAAAAAAPPRRLKKRLVRRRWTRRPPYRPEPPAEAAPLEGPPGAVRLARVPGSASEPLQLPERGWTAADPPRGVARSAYVCRNLACVDWAAKRKAYSRGLGGASVPQMLLDSLRDATRAELAAAAAAEAAGEPPPGLSPLQLRLLALQPRIAPQPPASLRGPFDKWPAPPSEPR